VTLRQILRNRSRRTGVDYFLPADKTGTNPPPHRAAADARPGRRQLRPGRPGLSPGIGPIAGQLFGLCRRILLPVDSDRTVPELSSRLPSRWPCILLDLARDVGRPAGHRALLRRAGRPLSAVRRRLPVGSPDLPADSWLAGRLGVPGVAGGHPGGRGAGLAAHAASAVTSVSARRRRRQRRRPRHQRRCPGRGAAALQHAGQLRRHPIAGAHQQRRRLLRAARSAATDRVPGRSRRPRTGHPLRHARPRRWTTRRLLRPVLGSGRDGGLHHVWLRYCRYTG
jgi:hypothetical protein